MSFWGHCSLWIYDAWRLLRPSGVSASELADARKDNLRRIESYSIDRAMRMRKYWEVTKKLGEERWAREQAEKSRREYDYTRPFGKK